MDPTRLSGTALEWAARIGAAWADTELFVDVVSSCPHRRVATMLVKVGSALSALQGPARLRYITNHVMDCELKLAYFLGPPLDDILLQASTLTARSPEEVPFAKLMHAILDREVAGMPERIACSVAPVLIQLTATSENLDVLVDLSVRLMRMEPQEVTPMFEDSALFDNLAKRAELTVVIGRLCQIPFEKCPRMARVCTVGKVICRCIHMSKPMYASQSFAFDALLLMEICASVCGDDLAEVLVDGVVAHGRSGWVYGIGGLVRRLTAGPSVRLVVLLEKNGCLDTLILAASRFRSVIESEASRGRPPLHSSWGVALCQLRRQWPERVAEVLNEPYAAPLPVTEYTCPVTLCECVDPVVASDGHTYERNAILKHVCRNGAFSPLTKGLLELRLVPNRAVYNRA